jgi:uncharacterized protein (DUF736 family)
LSAIAFPSSRARHTQRGLDGACLTEGRLTLFGSIGIRNGRLVFFPWRLRRHSSRNKKASAHGRPPLRFGLFRCGPIAPGLIDSHRGRDGRGPSKKRNRTMATIGSFTASENGFSGTIKTLNLNVKAKIVRVERTSEDAPDFRVLAGNVEFGAGWQKQARETERDYISVKLDDPSFPAPIYATLTEVQGQEGLQLIWSRNTRR